MFQVPSGNKTYPEDVLRGHLVWVGRTSVNMIYGALTLLETLPGQKSFLLSLFGGL